MSSQMRFSKTDGYALSPLRVTVTVPWNPLCFAHSLYSPADFYAQVHTKLTDADNKA